MNQDQISSFGLALALMSAIAATIWIFRFTVVRWHVDVERSDGVVRDGQGAIARAFLVGILAMASVDFPDVANLFGFLSALQLSLDWAHLFALLAGMTTLFVLLEAYRDPSSVVVGLVTLGGAVVIFLGGGSEASAWMVAGLLICASPLVWFLRLQLVAPIHPLPFKIWITHIFQRGAMITPLPQLRDAFDRQISVSAEAPVYFGFNSTPIELATGHYLFAGGSGTGKSIQKRLMMQSVLPRFGPHSNQRALIFDAKHDEVSVVLGMGLNAPVYITNPFDERCAVWDMAIDFNTPSDAQQLAKLVLPEEKADNDPFWRNFARGVIADVVRAHILAYREQRIPHWSFPDIIRSLDGLEAIQEALALHPSTAQSLRNLREEKTLHGVLATIDLVRREFEVVAALLDRPFTTRDRVFSLSQWMQESGVIILGPSATAEEVISPYNRLFITRIGQLLLDAPEVPTDGTPNCSRTWFFLDEFPRLGRMPRIENLMTNVRSKGGIFVLGIQEYSDLKELYGPNYSVTIGGACTHKMMFQSASTEMSEYCEKLLLNEDVIAVARSESTAVFRPAWFSPPSPTGSTETISYAPSEKTRPLFTKDQFQSLGKPGERTPLFLVPDWLHRVRHWPVFQHVYRFWAVSHFSPIRAISSVQGRRFQDERSFTRSVEALSPPTGEGSIPRPVADQFLQSWITSDPVPPASPPAPPFDVKKALFDLKPNHKTRPKD